MLDYVFSKSILYRFMEFRSGEDCLRNLHLHPEVVVVDHQLSGMNGYETLLEIREQHPAAHVIMLLGENTGKLPSDFMKAGADDYVLKDGAEIPALMEKIEKQLQHGSSLNSPARRKTAPLKKKLYYALIILLLLSVGVYYYQ